MMMTLIFLSVFFGQRDGAKISQKHQIVTLGIHKVIVIIRENDERAAWATLPTHTHTQRRHSTHAVPHQLG